MKVLRTPDERFADLKDYPSQPNYIEIDAGDGAEYLHLRQSRHMDEGVS